MYFPENKERLNKSFLIYGAIFVDYGKKRVVQIANSIESSRVAVRTDRTRDRFAGTGYFLVLLWAFRINQSKLRWRDRRYL